jgi:hypothetical protein
MFACQFLIGCSESKFDLAPESRIPKWFKLPQGKSRADVNITMDYYVMPWGRRAEFKMCDKNGIKIAEVTGSQKGYEPIKLQNRNSELPEGYPSYEIITADKITEVIEHRRPEAIFYINDDSSVHAKLGVQ